MTQPPIVTLLTDFGVTDGYVGVMKGVILQITPQARLVDITHDLPPYSIAGASFLMEWAYGYFPAGTIHLCVVDPGVGTRRRVLILETQGHFFVAPDNGLLTPFLQSKDEKKIISADNRLFWLDKISNTFHGRDIFSPLAAHLARGIPPTDMGEEIRDPVLLPQEPLTITPHYIECRIRYIDRFGNLVTNLSRTAYEQWAAKKRYTREETVISWPITRIQGISQTYGDKNRGELVAVFDGFDHLEIAVCGGNAAALTGLNIGEPITVGVLIAR